MPITHESVIAAMKARGFVVFETKDYDMNVVGLRRMPGTVNRFDDLICCFWKQSGAWQFRAWPCTTDPGTFYLNNPMNVNGTAIVRPGQYRRSHKLGKHGGETGYEAMVQVGTIGVWRDANKDSQLDYGVNPQDAQWAGINIHRAGTNSTQVDRWSAGCQVFSRSSDFAEFMSLIHRQSEAGIGDTISYSLLEWPAADFPGGA